MNFKLGMGVIGLLLLSSCASMVSVKGIHDTNCSKFVECSEEPTTIDKNVWSESRVKNLSGKDWDKFEEAISESVRNGTFVYDLTAGAR